ncbi:hypothetical protein BG006_007943 [Podila minutissima]|uniref:Uncharacterized protein n=1 Tax=Podila minutissima TaxID=64525 RepID=A0A9P5SJ67_9FUNG|nr:hypothetical protein BG006_007943 [Podila minutissima]
MTTPPTLTNKLCNSNHNTNNHNMNNKNADSHQEFLMLAEDYLLSLSPKKREKALLSNIMYQKILMVLLQPKNTQVSTAQFRFWAKKMFTLSTTTTHHIVCHGGKPVATKECLYDVLVYCHRKSAHGGRDKTSAEARLQCFSIQQHPRPRSQQTVRQDSLQSGASHRRYHEVGPFRHGYRRSSQSDSLPVSSQSVLQSSYSNDSYPGRDWGGRSQFTDDTGPGDESDDEDDLLMDEYDDFNEPDEDSWQPSFLKQHRRDTGQNKSLGGDPDDDEFTPSGMVGIPQEMRALSVIITVTVKDLGLYQGLDYLPRDNKN